jgi:hypothetical protein
MNMSIFIPKFVNPAWRLQVQKYFASGLTHENFIARLFSAGSMVGLSRSDRPSHLERSDAAPCSAPAEEREPPR